jgi:chromosome segregation ATPase
MELHTEDGLSAEVDRILDNTRRQLAEEFRRCVAEAAAQREQVLASSREAVSTELKQQFDQTLERTVADLKDQFAQQMAAAREGWAEEKDRLQDQAELWKSYADAQREMGESKSQAEILTHFLRHAETFAPNIAVYVARVDGLALWKTRGNGPFPAVVSKNTCDPETYFRAIEVRDKTVVGICARPPFSAQQLNFLSSCLERAIEAFGARIQYRAAKAPSP